MYTLHLYNEAIITLVWICDSYYTNIDTNIPAKGRSYGRILPRIAIEKQQVSSIDDDCYVNTPVKRNV